MKKCRVKKGDGVYLFFIEFVVFVKDCVEKVNIFEFEDLIKFRDIVKFVDNIKRFIKGKEVNFFVI